MRNSAARAFCGLLGSSLRFLRVKMGPATRPARKAGHRHGLSAAWLMRPLLVDEDPRAAKHQVRTAQLDPEVSTPEHAIICECDDRLPQPEEGNGIDCRSGNWRRRSAGSRALLAVWPGARASPTTSRGPQGLSSASSSQTSSRASAGPSSATGANTSASLPLKKWLITNCTPNGLTVRRFGS